MQQLLTGRTRLPGFTERGVRDCSLTRRRRLDQDLVSSAHQLRAADDHISVRGRRRDSYSTTSRMTIGDRLRSRPTCSSSDVVHSVTSCSAESDRTAVHRARSRSPHQSHRQASRGPTTTQSHDPAFAVQPANDSLDRSDRPASFEARLAARLKRRNVRRSRRSAAIALTSSRQSRPCFTTPIRDRVARRRLDKAKAIKQGMMQELLTGRTRLPVLEAAVMSNVGQLERKTQDRVVELFRERSATTTSATGSTARQLQRRGRAA